MVFLNYSTMQMVAKIVYYGPGLCGKTTNLKEIYRNTSSKSRGEMVSLETETDRTLFFDLLPMDVGVVGGFKTKFQLYTVPGQVFYNSTRKLVLRGVDGIVFVADSQRPMFDANMNSYENLLENLKELNLEISDIPLVYQYNKRDLPNVIPVEEMNNHLNPNGNPYIEASALQGEGVFETLKEISKLTLVKLHVKALDEQQSHNLEAAGDDEVMLAAGAGESLDLEEDDGIEDSGLPEIVSDDPEDDDSTLDEDELEDDLSDFDLDFAEDEDLVVEEGLVPLTVEEGTLQDEDPEPDAQTEIMEALDESTNEADEEPEIGDEHELTLDDLGTLPSAGDHSEYRDESSEEDDDTAPTLELTEEAIPKLARKPASTGPDALRELEDMASQALRTKSRKIKGADASVDDLLDGLTGKTSKIKAEQIPLALPADFENAQLNCIFLDDTENVVHTHLAKVTPHRVSHGRYKIKITLDIEIQE